jgi:hypothetical protein
VEIIPSEIANVVSKPLQNIPHRSRHINNACGYESLNNAIINAQDIGSRLLGKVKPENLLFVFGESVQSLQSSLCEFFDGLLVKYPKSECYDAINAEQDGRANKNDGEPYAIVLCKKKAAIMPSDTR